MEFLINFLLNKNKPKHKISCLFLNFIQNLGFKFNFLKYFELPAKTFIFIYPGKSK